MVEYNKATNWEERQRCTGREGVIQNFLVRRQDGVAYGTLESNTQIPFATVYSKCVS